MYLCKLQKCVVSAKSESTTEQTKNGRKMKYKKIILGVALALACFSSQNANALTESKVKKTEAQLQHPTFTGPTAPEEYLIPPTLSFRL